MDLAELLTVETSVLQALCMSTASESSELRDTILKELEPDDFYFPITRTIYSAVSTMSQDNTPVDADGLLRALSRRSVDVPDDFFLEDLFTGTKPSKETLAGWLKGVKNGDEEKEPDTQTKPKAKVKTKPNVAPPTKPTQPTQPTLADTHRSVKVSFPPPSEASPAGAPEAKREREIESTKTSGYTSLSQLVAAPAKKPAAGSKAPPRGGNDILAPESGEWLGYLADLTKHQGEHLKTGFSIFDRHWGGLAPGFFLLAGEDQPRLLDFLKQLVDQVANECKVPCLYFSFERTKAELRLYTLSRLSRAPSAHIQGGKFTKESEEWQNIIRAGEQAVDWLQRIYMVEPTPGLPVSRIRDMRQTLIESGAGATCLIAIDNLEKLASKTDLLQALAELKELAESLGIVVIGVASKVELVHEKSADMAASFVVESDATVLEVTTLGASEPRELRFNYDPATHRFEE